MADPLDDFFDEPDMFEEEETLRPAPRKQLRPGCFLNLLSGIFVAGTLVVVLLFSVIFVNPQSTLNPLPPTTVPVIPKTLTPSPTPRPVLPPTWTPTLDVSGTPTPSPEPSNTPEPTLESSPIPTADLESGTTFDLQVGSPSYEINTYHPDAGCNWLGVAGQIFDNESIPVSGVLVEVGGTLGGVDVSGITLSGMAPNYGEGGYELTLHDSPIASENEAWIQLVDQANLPLSEKFYFQTFDSCDLNLIKNHLYTNF